MRQVRTGGTGAAAAGAAAVVPVIPSRRSSRRGQVGSKNTNEATVMIHGNAPMSKSTPVIVWNPSNATKANGRVRRHESQSTMVRS
jgi:hypothetical protein